jgi:hypothetical protein
MGIFFKVGILVVSNYDCADKNKALNLYHNLNIYEAEYKTKTLLQYTGTKKIALVCTFTFSNLCMQAWLILRSKNLSTLSLKKYVIDIKNIFWSFHPSVCSRLTFYWKLLRSCNMAQHFRLLPAIIGYLLLFFDFF